MKRRLLLSIMGLSLALVLSIHGQDQLPLKLIQTIPMPNVRGRMDHLGVDVKGKRLFAAALGENQNTVEVLDLKAGKRVFSITGQSISSLIACRLEQMQITWATTRRPNTFMSELASPIQKQERWPLSTRAPINILGTSRRMSTPAASRSRNRGREFS